MEYQCNDIDDKSKVGELKEELSSAFIKSDPQNVDVKERKRNESSFILTVQTLVDKRDIKPLESSLQLMKSGIENVISTELTKIEEISSIKDTVNETRDKTKKTQWTLKDIKKELETSLQSLNKSSNLAKLKTLGELDGFLSSMGLYISWGMNEGEIEGKIHAKYTQSAPSFDVHYSGNVEFNGSQFYSGNKNYSHRISSARSKCSCNEFGPFPASSSNNSKCDYCGASAKYCSHCGNKFPEPTATNHGRWQYTEGEDKGRIYLYTESKEFTGNVFYSGNVNYTGSKPYSGYTKATCSSNHHNCSCDSWSQMVLSFREALEEKDYYKRSFNEQKVLLDNLRTKHQEVQDIVNDIVPKMNLIEEKSHFAITNIQRERQLFLSGLKDQQEKTVFAFNVMNQLHQSEKIFQEQLITIVKNNEEQQRNEKNRLQEEIRNKDK
ncbi:unnamed protein product, partial [Didymodactylos carnosus]